MDLRETVIDKNTVNTSDYEYLSNREAAQKRAFLLVPDGSSRFKAHTKLRRSPLLEGNSISMYRSGELCELFIEVGQDAYVITNEWSWCVHIHSKTRHHHGCNTIATTPMTPSSSDARPFPRIYNADTLTLDFQP